MALQNGDWIVLSEICPVGPWQDDPSEQVFAMMLSFAYYWDPGQEVNADLDVEALLPWNFEVTGFKGLLREDAGSDAPPVPVAITAVSTPTGSWTQSGKERLQENLLPQFTAGAQLVWPRHPSLTVQDQDLAELPDLPSLLGHLRTYPGGIAQSFNLVHYFKVDSLDLSGGAEQQLVLAPILKRDDNEHVPIDSFDFRTEQAWPYEDPTLSHSKTVPRRLSLKQNSDGLVYDGLMQTVTDDLDFKSYWAPVRKAMPWGDQIERLLEGLNNFQVLLTDFDAFLRQQQTEAKVFSALEAAAWGFRIHERLIGWRPLEWLTELQTLNVPTDNLRQLYRDYREEINLDTLQGFFKVPHEQQLLDLLDQPYPDFLPATSNEGPTLRELFPLAFALLLWDLGGEAIPKDFFEKAKEATVQDGLASFYNARRQGAMLGLEVSCKQFALKAGSGDPQKIIEFISDTLNEHFVFLDEQFRVDGPLWALFPGLFSKDEVREDLLKQLSIFSEHFGVQWVQTFVEEYIEDARNALSGLRTTDRKPRGLTVQLGRVVHEQDPVVATGSEAETMGADDPDRWHKITGVLPFCREAVDGAHWHLLSAARLTGHGFDVRQVLPFIEGNGSKKLRLVIAPQPEATVGIQTVRIYEHYADGQSLGVDGDSITVVADDLAQPLFAKVIAAPAELTGDGVLEACLNELTTKPLPIPVRPVRRDMCPQQSGQWLHLPFLTYNQRSLIAPSPLGEAISSRFKGSLEGESSGVTKPFGYKPVLSGDMQAQGGIDYRPLRLLPLKFGRTYQMAAALMDIGGGLPTGLQGDTGVFKYSDWQLPSTGGEVAEIDYYRYVPVGQVRAYPLKGSTPDPEASWPEIPDDVFPLIRELQPEGEAEVVGSDEKEDTPLILLAQDGDRFRFEVRPPAVDLDVMERTLPDGKAFKPLAQEYWRRVVNSAGTPDGVVEKDQDVTLDDPAVMRLQVRLLVWEFESTSKNPARGRFKPFSPDLSADIQLRDLPLWQYDEVTLVDVQQKLHIEVVRTGTDFKLEPIPGEGPFAVRVDIPDRVSATSMVKLQINAVLDKPVEAGFRDGYYEPGLALNAFELMLEAPIYQLPRSEDIFQNLRAKGIGNRVEVCLNPVVEESKEPTAPWMNIYRVELYQQRWTWNGRPLPPQDDGPDWRTFEFKVDLQKDVWLDDAFYGKDPVFDAVVLEKTFEPFQSDPAPIHVELFDQDRRAQLERYAVRVFSRYAGLSPLRFVDGQKPGERGRSWKSAYLPYRGGIPKVPLVRAWMPLTESVEKGPAEVAPIMVVLNEAAFDHCGISEGLQVQVIQSTPVKAEFGTEPAAPEAIAQLGPDPVLYQDNPAELYKLQVGESREFSELSGPFGYSQDPERSEALFNYSSYVVHPIDGMRPWDLAQVRFRRLTGVAELDAAGANWSAPSWLQFLPAANGLSDVRVSRQGKRLTLTLPKPSHYQQPTTELSRRFFYVLVMTQKIGNYLKRSNNQEQYEKTVMCRDGLNQNGELELVAEMPVQYKSKNCRIRIMEVQIATLGGAQVPQSGESFWQGAFEGDHDQDVPYRIV
jgi:hypothetical protein